MYIHLLSLITNYRQYAFSLHIFVYECVHLKWENQIDMIDKLKFLHIVKVAYVANSNRFDFEGDTILDTIRIEYRIIVTIRYTGSDQANGTEH
jgi:hypothetical protein